MDGRIELLNQLYEVTVAGCGEKRLIRIGDGPVTAAVLTGFDSADQTITLGDQRAAATIRVRGEKIYIRAFGRTFDLRIVDPVEQACERSGRVRNRAVAPMPGIVVVVHTETGDEITKNQTLMTIESMKILTAIPAPRNGRVDRIHFVPGQPFEKGAVLVTLAPDEDERHATD